MANEFIARKGLIALDDTQITGSLGVSGSLELKGSGSTLFNIVGSEGTLFSITDSLSGSLFAVSDVSGLPILEVFSDDTVKIGSFNDEAITVSGSHTTIGGVLAIPGFTNVSASLAAATAGGGTITGVTAGDGLTGGGTAGTVTLNVVGGTGITANSNDIAVDATIATVVQLDASSSALQSNIDAKASITQLNASSSALQTNIDAKASITQLNASSSALQTNIDAKASITQLNASSSALQTNINTKVSNSSTASFAITGSNVLFANITSSGNISASGVLSIPGFTNVSASLASLTSGGGTITGVTAGTGLTGGGTTGTVTLNVIGGTGITANANDIAVDATIATVVQLDASSSALQTNIDAKASITQLTATQSLLQTNIDAKASITQLNASSSALQTNIDAKVSNSSTASFAITGSNVTFTNITASGNISASGTGYFNAIRMPQDDGSLTSKLYFGSAPGGDNGYLYDDETNLHIGYNDSDVLSINGATPQVSVTGNFRVFGGGGGNITASGDISASGTFISNGVTVDATGFGASDNALQVVNSSGTPIFEVEGTGDVTANESGRVAAFNILRVAAGAQSAPSISFTSDSNTGIYNPSADQINIQAGGGTTELIVNTSGVTVNNGALAIPGFSNVSASLAAASGGGGTTYRTVIESSCYLAQTALRYLPFNSLSEQTIFNYLSITPAAADGKVVSITMWPQSSGGSTVVGLHINSNATAATTDTQTISAGTPLTFTFSSGNTFSQNDELSFSVASTSNINGLASQIVLEYDL